MLPDEVESIGRWAFAQCSSLKTVFIPSSVQSIGFGAFSECDLLTNLDLPYSRRVGYRRPDLFVDNVEVINWYK